MYRDTPLHRRRNVKGLVITQKQACTGTGTKEKDCTGTGHYTGKGIYRDRKSENLTRTFAVLVIAVPNHVVLKKPWVAHKSKRFCGRMKKTHCIFKLKLYSPLSVESPFLVVAVLPMMNF